jgi:hypothetical protein
MFQGGTVGKGWKGDANEKGAREVFNETKKERDRVGQIRRKRKKESARSGALDEWNQQFEFGCVCCWW